MDITRALANVTSTLRSLGKPTALLVAVSKYKPVQDIQTCYAAGQRHFGENYVQELQEKAGQLPEDVKWHFIGTFQTNKAKVLASIPNLYAVHTITSVKAANALNKALPEERSANPLNVLVQVNTSGEESKSGLEPSSGELKDLAKFIVGECPKLRLRGLMTIGALERSVAANEADENADFDCLKSTRDVLEEELKKLSSDGRWGDEETGRLVLSMGMSSDYEAALRAGSDIVRVGSSIFGARPPKDSTS